MKCKQCWSETYESRMELRNANVTVVEQHSNTSTSMTSAVSSYIPILVHGTTPIYTNCYHDWGNNIISIFPLNCVSHRLKRVILWAVELFQVVSYFFYYFEVSYCCPNVICSCHGSPVWFVWWLCFWWGSTTRDAPKFDNFQALLQTHKIIVIKLIVQDY